MEVLKELGATDEMLSAVLSSILNESSQTPFKEMETESLQNLLFRREFCLVHLYDTLNNCVHFSV